MPPARHQKPAAIGFEIRCDLGDVRGAGKRVHAFLASNGCSEAEVTNCELALVEACNNAIRYAKADSRKLPVRVDARCEDHGIELRVTDHTSGLDWARPAFLPGADSESGRGVYLIKVLMDSSEYLQRADHNVLVLRKTRD